jgi:hypothetical protein
MADIEACSETEFHGVVHLLSHEQMGRLDALELTCRRIIVKSINYQDTSHLAYVYKLTADNLSTYLPSERSQDYNKRS